MRAGELDLVTARHAVAHVGQIDGIVFTHADVICPERVPVCVGYGDEHGASLPVDMSTHEAVKIGQPSGVEMMTIHEIAEQVGSRVVVTSHGPTHEHKREI